MDKKRIGKFALRKVSCCIIAKNSYIYHWNNTYPSNTQSHLNQILQLLLKASKFTYKPINMRLIISILILITLCSCRGEYFPNSKYTTSYTPKVAVNSIICPDSTIKIDVRWSKKVGDASPFKAVDGARVTLKEDGQTIISETTVDGMVEKEIYPSAGKLYQLTVVVEGQPEISATTTIPEQSDIQFTTRCKVGGSYSMGGGYILVDVNKVIPAPGVRGLWIEKHPSEYKTDIYKSFYSNNPFIDQVNAEREMQDVSYRESNTYFSDFIRIPKNSFSLIAPFTFSTCTMTFGNEQYKLTHIYLTLNTPSDDYDKFYRSAYKQLSADPAYSPFVEIGTSVYTNIKNGLGIFAGCNKRAIKVEIDNPLDK